jgi:hypothetical protein
MQKHLSKNRKALSSLSLIILLLIAAIIGGIISYLWVAGYYVSLKEKIPEQDMVAITNLSFNPQNATAFNVTLLNPSFSPSDKTRVVAIGYTGQNENTLHLVRVSIPSLTTPFNLPRGTNETFLCRGDLSPYVNQTVTVSVFVLNGSGSTNSMKIPYTQLFVNPDFNPNVGVKNFTVTLRNAPLSIATLSVTGISISTQSINTTLITPTLPYTLAPNKTVTLSLNYNWSSYASIGGPQQISVLTKEGYSASNSTQVPKLAFSIQQITFNETDTKHFTVKVMNQVSANTPLNVSRIEVLMENGTVKDVTPSLDSHTNGVLGNSTATFTVSWDWTNYRSKNAIVTVYMLQGVKASGQQVTRPAAPLSVLGPPTLPDLQHVLITVKNSQYALRAANVTKITVTLENGTEIPPLQITQPSTPPYLIGIGNVTMFSAYWNWTTYLGKTVNINIYTDEGFAAFRAITTPTSISNYTVYLTIPSTPIFNTADMTRFNVTIHNSQVSSGNADITRITVLLANGTEIDSTFTPQTLTTNSTVTYTCGWDWAAYRNKGIVIRVYTNDGLKAIYVTKTP